MLSKLHCAKLSTQLGCETIIFNAQKKNVILGYLLKNDTGKFKNNEILTKTLTICLTQNKKLSFKHKWLAAGSVTHGVLYLDEGATRSVEQRKNLLAVGIKEMSGDFEKKDCVQLYTSDKDKRLIGIARTNYSSKSIKELIKKKSNKTKICSTDEIAVF